MLERIALYLGMYPLFYVEDPDDYQRPGDDDNSSRADGESST